MKKRILSLVMVVVMSLAVLPFGAVQVSAQEGLSYDAAVAYKAVIDEAYAKYGDYVGYDGSSNELTGLGLVRLIDFDGDGTQELVIGCGTRENDEFLFYEVYGYKNGLVKYTHTYCCASFELAFLLHFTQKGNNIYAVTSSGDICEGRIYFATIEAGKWVVTEFYEHTGGICGEWCEYGESDIWRINGVDVSNAEWTSKMDEYKLCDPEQYVDDGWEYYYFSEYGTEYAIDAINGVINKNVKPNDYVAIFGEFVNGRKDFSTQLEDLLMAEYSTCGIEFLKDCYMVDMNNDSVPELLCIFCDEWDMDEYAVLIEYDGQNFKLGKEIPFNYNSGSAGSEYYRVLKADGKFYYEKYTSVRQDWESPDGTDSWISENTITLNVNGNETVVYSATHSYGVNYVNGQLVDEIDDEYVYKNFEIVADGQNYGEVWSDHEPQFGNDYDRFWTTNNAITVTLDGEKITFDQNPIIVNDRTLVPMRAIFEELGAVVEWDAGTRTVTATKGETVVEMTIGNSVIYVDGKPVTLDVAPQIVGDRTLAPARAVAEGFGCDVDWDANTRTVIITSK